LALIPLQWKASALLRKLPAVHAHLTANGAFPRIEAKERKNLELEEPPSFFAAESAGTAFLTDHVPDPFRIG
jgi:hypothetical protein